ncbi:hypothetical protein DM02DRAFT_198761 [Periconia macrospinosa]|uniref:Uncharacterized protein n=1 Tax=Periconia macrospinosa TaxID=97972 RepID=A0A2V1DAR4_9PLEO|nr:hypothetical protein DM02DRAFT_198761 [Periconia macrospinosa]
MCWIKLSPKDPQHRHHHHHHQHHTRASHGSSVEELVRVRHDAHSPRYQRVHLVTPIRSTSDSSHHSHHLHHHHPHLHHLHPLHMHPLHHHSYHHHDTHRLHGIGKKRTSPTPPPPPSRSPSCPSPREPVYRTQLVEPRVQEVRETTRIALREGRPDRRDRGRLRRVAGYEVLGREVPWSWDCVSSVASGKDGDTSKSRHESRRGSVVSRFPPFGTMDQWL